MFVVVITWKYQSKKKTEKYLRSIGAIDRTVGMQTAVAVVFLKEIKTYYVMQCSKNGGGFMEGASHY